MVECPNIMNKKFGSYILSLLLIVTLLLLVSCAISTATEQLTSTETTQSSVSKELPFQKDTVQQPAIEKPVIENQDQLASEKPMIEDQELPTPEEVPVISEILILAVHEGMHEIESSSEDIPSGEIKKIDQMDERAFVKTVESYPVTEASVSEKLPTNLVVVPEVNSDSIEQEPLQENPSTSTASEIKRSPMQTSIMFLVILMLLMILLIFFIVKLRKANHRFEIEHHNLWDVKQKLDSEHDKLQEVQQRLEAEHNRVLVLGIPTIEAAQRKQKELELTITTLESQLIIVNDEYLNLKGEKASLEDDYDKLDKKVDTQKLKLARTKELYKAIEYAVERFHETDIPSEYFRPLTEEEMVDLDTIAPSVMLNLNYMNYQDLRKEFRANQKQIDGLLEVYAARYTTKANQSIYKLMVISLRSELQNILYNLKYEKLENALFQVQSLVAKYLVIVSEGNQQVASTMRKFVGELEHLFGNAVKIEYEYYIKREQAHQEQLALRQQMREEAEERKRLEEQKKQIALEESKYQAEIEKIQEMLKQEPEGSAKSLDILAKLDQLNTQLAQVEEKKEEITKLQNGKAGNVYIISNLGSFGEHVFKIGMTRRLDPQDRVDELGSASVPFKFDVHSFIFSEDAVGLEGNLHQRLHGRRLNKVNLRKEFFDVSIEELEQLVEEINPTAEFNRTMLADDYKQSLSMGDQELPLSSPNDGFQDEEDQEELETDENEDQLQL